MGEGEGDIQFSAVIPCYNERRRLPPTLAAVREYLARAWKRYEIVVVDDGSTDGTGDWVREQARDDARIRLVGYGGNRGKGYAVKQGMLDARGDYMLFMDADGSTAVTEVEQMCPLLERGEADIVIGSRKELGAQIKVSQNLPRHVAGVVFSYLIRWLVCYGVKDTQCGFKLFTRKAARDVFCCLTGSSALFDVEVLVLAVQKGHRVREVPVAWRHDHDSRLTYDLKKSLRIFGELLRIKIVHRLVLPVRIT